VDTCEVGQRDGLVDVFVDVAFDGRDIRIHRCTGSGAGKGRLRESGRRGYAAFHSSCCILAVLPGDDMQQQVDVAECATCGDDGVVVDQHARGVKPARREQVGEGSAQPPCGGDVATVQGTRVSGEKGPATRALSTVRPCSPPCPRAPRRAATTALRLIQEHPGLRALDLADYLGRDKLPFKADVRRLKALGLTESLETGCRLSSRGKALVTYLRS
jgi:hypothetical protein